MFTGIVEATGKVVKFEEKQSAWLLELEVPQFIADSLAESCIGCKRAFEIYERTFL